MRFLQPLVFSAQSFKRRDSGFRPMKHPAYHFIKQNEDDPKEKYYPHENCQHEQRSEKFLNRVEIHNAPTRLASYDSLETHAELSKVPIGRRNMRKNEIEAEAIRTGSASVAAIHG